MSRRVAILQSNYIPWKGYFDMINMVDEFILFDDVQYTKRDWRNRNKIQTANGLLWLTIPVDVKNKYFQAIKDTRVSEDKWSDKHWKSILHSYNKAPFFTEVQAWLEPLYLNNQDNLISAINYNFITAICNYLDIDTKITWSSDYTVVDDKNQRLIQLCLQANGTTYLSGPAAQSYLDEKQFTQEGITVEWMDYSGYPEYKQQHSPFEHGVTILDLLFNKGKESKQYMKSF